MPKNITFIEELPELEELEEKYVSLARLNSEREIPSEQMINNKYIRNLERKFDDMSGMNPSASQKEKYIHNVGNINIPQPAHENHPVYSQNYPQPYYQQPYPQPYYQQPYQTLHQDYQQQSNEYFRYPQYQNQSYHSKSVKENYKDNSDNEDNEDNEDETSENYTSSTAAPCSFNCRDIAFHIVDCPVCSKLYYNDKTMYIIIIIVLFCVILILLQKLLNSGKF